MAIDPFSAAAGGVRARVRLSPGAAANRIAAIERDGDGNGLIKATVTTVAEAGKANAALIKMLGREWKIAKTTITVSRGATNRNKIIFIAGETAPLIRRLRQWLGKF